MADWQTDILNHVQRPGYRAVKPVSLARRMAVPKKSLHEFRDALRGLVDGRRLAISPAGRVTPKAGQDSDGLVGTLSRKSAGGVVRHPSDDDPTRVVFIEPSDLRDAMDGDTVRLKLLKRRKSGGDQCAKVVEVVERARMSFVGRYAEKRGKAVVELQGRQLPGSIVVGDPGAKSVRPGDMVVVDVVKFPTAMKDGEGVIGKVLGPRGVAGVDTQTVIVNHNLPGEFPEEAMDEAHARVEEFNSRDLDGREDLTGELVVTIDPATARDFDDAISLKKDKRGHWELGVHIADVSAFVLPGSPLDDEAKSRATSVYLPTRVIPMLPEVISNGIASLQEGRRRYTKTAFIEFTADGTPVHTRLARTVIENKKRFRYEEVMPVVNDEPGHIEVNKPVKKLLKDMHTLAMKLRERRFKRGALELHNPELRLKFDADMQVSGAEVEHHDPSHQVIEEFMLAANIAVANALNDKGWDFARRAHPEPDELRLKKFKEFVGALGYELGDPRDRHAQQSILDEVKGTPEEKAVNFAMLRSMQRAVYTAEPIGHYALAEPQYCHFTSPIRRYPDLLIHRQIEALLAGRKSYKGPSGAVLERLCQHCSDMSRRAEAAERELTSLKLLGYFEERIGEEMQAVITGVQKFGLFAQGKQLPVEGMIPMRDLPDDYYDFEEERYQLTGRKGRTFRLGDELRVKVAAVDMDRRQLQFAYVETTSKAKAAKKKKSRRGSGGSRGSAKSKATHGPRGGEKSGRKAAKKRGR